MSKEPIERLRDLELIVLHLATIHPGLFADVDPNLMPEPDQEPVPTPTPEPAPAPSAPPPDDEEEPEPADPPPGPGPDPVSVPPPVVARGRRGGRS